MIIRFLCNEIVTKGEDKWQAEMLARPSSRVLQGNPSTSFIFSSFFLPFMIMEDLMILRILIILRNQPKFIGKSKKNVFELLQTMGMAMILDVIINYVRSLQNQIDVSLYSLRILLWLKLSGQSSYIQYVLVYMFKFNFYLYIFPIVSFNETISSEFILWFQFIGGRSYRNNAGKTISPYLIWLLTWLNATRHINCAHTFLL